MQTVASYCRRCIITGSMSNCHKVKVLFVQSDGGKLIIYMIKSIKRNRTFKQIL